MVGFVVGLELLREVTRKKIIPSFRLPSRVAGGAFVLQVNCAYTDQGTSFAVVYSHEL